ncbi:MAG: HAD family hydrolase [Treponema sp.]|nr:HAD family hydrolase [Treponema sp.]
MDIKWIFFDVGSTLVDETKAYDHRAKEMLQNTNITFDEFDNKRIEFAKLGYDGNSQAIKYFQLEKTPWPSSMEVPFADVANTLETLKKRGYNLGIIANQELGTKDRLQQQGILQYIDLVIASAEEGVAKPDEKIFKIALQRAACKSDNAIMIGDRIDNDIIPAKKLGFHTIWIKQGFGQYWNITKEEETPDYTVCSLSELCDIL